MDTIKLKLCILVFGVISCCSAQVVSLTSKVWRVTEVKSIKNDTFLKDRFLTVSLKFNADSTFILIKDNKESLGNYKLTHKSLELSFNLLFRGILEFNELVFLVTHKKTSIILMSQNKSCLVLK